MILLLYFDEPPPHPDTSSWRPQGPRTLLWEPQRKQLLVTTNTCLPGFCIPASCEAAFCARRGLRPSLLTCNERISMKTGDKCSDLWTECKTTWDLIHMESPVGRKWEADNIPQSADEAIHRAFRVKRHDVSNVEKTGSVLWHVHWVVHLSGFPI